MHPTLKRNFEVFSASDWLAALTAHIPNAGEHLVRYYGWCSNVNRGKRRKAQGEVSTAIVESSEIAPPEVKRAWAPLIKQVYEVDPLVCSSGVVGRRERSCPMPQGPNPVRTGVRAGVPPPFLSC